MANYWDGTAGGKHSTPAAQTVYVRVRLTLDAGVDAEDVIDNMDYEFRYPGILDSEVVDSE